MFLPHTLRGRRFAALIALAAVCALIAIQTARADDSLQRKHKQLQHQVKSAQHDVEEASGALRKAQAALNAAQKKLDVANAALAQTRAALDKATKRDNALRKQLADSRQRLRNAKAAVVAAQIKTENQRDAIGEFASQTYQSGSPELFQVLTVLRSGSASEISARLGVIDAVMGKQDALFHEFQQQVAELTAKKAEVATVTAKIAGQQKAAAKVVKQRRTLTAAAQKQQQAVATLVANRAHARKRAAAAKRADQAKLAKLKKEDARIKRQILARKRHDPNRTWTGGGMLLRPVNGPITSAYGWRVHPIYGYWGLHDGDDFAASCGSAQVAAAGGTVMSEYYSDVWGNRLYIDLGNINGHNYTVIHNHLSGYAVRVGQHVSRGQVVGYTGTTGWSTGCHLHYTVLRDGVAVNPSQYF